MRRLLLCLVNLSFILAATAVAAGERTGIVVELYTSQGCSSCPPADEFLAELARRPDVVALAFHVDYWDHLGWRDPYARAGNAKRQRGYATMLGGRYVYTPQMVVDGSLQDVGSNRQRIEHLIAKAARQRAAAPTIELRGDTLVIGAAPAEGQAGVWLMFFASTRANDVAAGENHGRRMRTTNVVRAVQLAGRFDGAQRSLAFDRSAAPADCDGVAVVVQQDGPGRILAARAFDLPPR